MTAYNWCTTYEIHNREKPSSRREHVSRQRGRVLVMVYSLYSRRVRVLTFDSSTSYTVIDSISVMQTFAL